MTTADTSPAFFDSMYARDDDPWHFASSEYEQGRYTAIINALAHRKYERAFEPGCSIGVLTAKLAPLCGTLLALDGSAKAIEQAHMHCRGFDQVQLACGTLPDDFPGGAFDLIVLSEIGYYFEEEDLVSLAGLLIGSLQPGGTFLASHWLGQSDDHVLHGSRIHQLLHTLGGLTHACTESHPGFVLDRWTRA